MRLVLGSGLGSAEGSAALLVTERERVYLDERVFQKDVAAPGAAGVR